MKKYTTIEPTQMDKLELIAICGELQSAINYNQSSISVELKSGGFKEIKTEALQEYQNAFKPIVGETKV